MAASPSTNSTPGAPNGPNSKGEEAEGGGEGEGEEGPVPDLVDKEGVKAPEQAAEEEAAVSGVSGVYV